MTTDTRPTAADAGCWIAGRDGDIAFSDCIEVAIGYGWELSETEQAALEAFKQDADTFVSPVPASYPGVQYVADWIINQGGLLDGAVEWLNEHVAPEGFAFGWMDGDFFLQPDEWWEE
jgi:hypothetical protein